MAGTSLSELGRTRNNNKKITNKYNLNRIYWIMTLKRYKPNIKAKAYINELSKPTVKSETNQKVVFEQSLFPLRDNRTKKDTRASARART